MNAKDNAEGTCFTDALNVAMELGFPDDGRIVHGLPWGTGGDAGDRRYWHAWVEAFGFVWVKLDGRTAMLDRDVFYATGRIEHTWTYTMDEVDGHVLNTGHAGPWEGKGDDDWERIIRELHPGERTEYDPIEEYA